MRSSSTKAFIYGILVSLVMLVASIPFLADQTVSFRGKRLVKEQGVWYQEEGAMRFQVEPDVISVRFRGTVSDSARAQLYADRGTAVIRQNRLGIVDLTVPTGEDAVGFAQRLDATGLFDFTDVNTLGVYTASPNDPLYSSQWANNNTGQTGGTPGADIDAPLAWDLTTGDPGVILAVLDSGTDIDHQDLNCNIWVNPGEDLDGDGMVWDTGDLNGVDDDGNGLVDDISGWDFHNGNNNPRGPFFHGTHVAGIVGACGNNGTGITGVAGGWAGTPGAKLLAVGVGDNSPNGSILDDSILYAAGEGARVITLSLSVGSSSAISAALDAAYADGVFIDNASGNGSSQVAYPGTHPAVMAVGATDDRDERASFSNFGPDLEIVAPGVDILSTQPGNGYGQSSGTSFASPHVAGVAGLMFSINSGATNEDVRSCLILTAEDEVGDSQDTPGRDDFYGHGRLNAFAALECVGNSAPGATSGLRLARSTSPGTIVLTWDPSCSETTQDYAIYSGLMSKQLNPLFANHIPVDCTDDDGDLTEEVGPSLIGSRYYLVVPVDATKEGSYGLDGHGNERPPGGLNKCRASQSLQGCR